MRVDPVAGPGTAVIDDAVAGPVSMGPFAVAGVAPRYVAMEGQGIVDDLVVRAVP